MKIEGKEVMPCYGLDDWEIVEESFSPETNYHSETVFATANGYIGMRGTFEEGLNSHIAAGFEGTFLNGVYEESSIEYGEAAYGFPKTSQTMINAANGKVIKLYLEDEEFSMLNGKLLEYRRSLNMKEGLVKRSLVWQSPKGKEIRLVIERMTCLQRKNNALIRYNITPLNFSGSIKIVSEIDGNVRHSEVGNDPRVGSALGEGALYTVQAVATGERASLLQKTRKTGINIACVIGGVLQTDCTYKAESYTDENKSGVQYIVEADKGKAIDFTKHIVYNTSSDSETAVLEQACEILESAVAAGYADLKREQYDFLADYWLRSDIEIKGDLDLQQAIRFNLYHLLQSVGRDGKTNICAKGLTGEGYEGHYFWDTEMYIVPAFLYSHPSISRKLLEYRFNTLDKARERAREMSHSKGALFPWRTIDGRECSAYFPAGTAQYHINADIAFAVKKYMEATQDNEFMLEYGAEILFETARIWADIGFFNEEKDGKFCINCVTGPDEYTAIVNNNCYTNLMAKENLQYAFETAQWMKAYDENAYIRLRSKLDLDMNELSYWKKAAEDMYIPFNERLGINPQDDSFLDKKLWDFENTPKDKYPLLLHFHPLVIYRHQVCKQADLVLALFLLRHKFNREQKIKNYEYYEKVTTHDSSLSTCIFSIVACDIGCYEKAYEYFKCTARMDLDDYHGNTRHGVHTANMAGSWMCIVNGFGGMHAYGDKIGFSPYLPENWDEYSFKVAHRGRLIKVTVNKKNTRYELLEGEEIVFEHKGKEYTMNNTAIVL